MRERYWLAAGLYTAIALALYFILINFIGGFVAGLSRGRASTSELEALSLAAVAAVLLLVLSVRPPGLRNLADAVRSMLQALARYPQAAQTLVALIARAPFTPSPLARPETVRELESYAVPSKVVDEALAPDNKLLAAAAAQLMIEVCSLHVSFKAIETERRYRSFFASKRRTIEDLDRQYHRWLRQAARALLLAEDLPVSGIAADQLVLEMSDFIAEDGELLQSHYRRLLAELTLSCASNPSERRRLLASFGYEVAVSRTLPFWPLIVVFVIDFAIAVVPAVLTSFIPAQSRMSTLSAAVLGLAHASALTMSVFFSIYPKLTSNFARPSLLSLPWHSYIFFGAVTYVIGLAIYICAFAIVDLPPAFIARRHPLAASAWFSLMFPVTTVVLSILLDLRLKNPLSDFQRGQIRDGIVLAVASGVMVMALQFGLFLIAAVYGLSAPPFPLGLRAAFTGLFAALGFVMGYVIPSTTEAHFKAVKIILAADLKGKPPAWSEDEAPKTSISQAT
jgi:MFS family permease